MQLHMMCLDCEGKGRGGSPKSKQKQLAVTWGGGQKFADVLRPHITSAKKNRANEVNERHEFMTYTALPPTLPGRHHEQREGGRGYTGGYVETKMPTSTTSPVFRS